MDTPPSTNGRAARSQRLETRLRRCGSVFAPGGDGGTVKVRRLSGVDGMTALGATPSTPGAPVPFEATITSCRYGSLVVGLLRHTPHITVRPPHQFGHCHPVTRLTVAIQGHATARLRSQQLPIRPGSGLLVPGSAPFTYEAPEATAALYIDVATDDPLVATLRAAKRCAYWPVHTPLLAALAGLARTLVDHEGQTASRHERTWLRHALESLTLSNLLLAPGLDGNKAGGSLRETAIAHMRARHSDPSLNVETLANDLGVSARTLQRAFPRDHTITDWLNHLRADHAIELLSDPHLADLTMTEVAHRAGFATTSRMRRTVLATTGHPPSEHRRRDDETTGRRE